MSHLRELADAYYIVARDLEARAYAMNKMGENLFEIADHLCEQHIKATAMEPAPEREGCNHFPGQVECEWCSVPDAARAADSAGEKP